MIAARGGNSQGAGLGNSKSDQAADKGKSKENDLKPCPPQRTKPERAQPKKSDSAVKAYEEKPDYLVEPTAKAVYTYDKVGNRTSMTTDQGTKTYTYDKANRLLSEGATKYYYDRAGNLTAKVTPDDEVLYQYSATGKMVKVTKSDETYVSFAYDAFGRKVRRTESAWVAQGNPNGAPPRPDRRQGLGQQQRPPGAGQPEQGRRQGEREGQGRHLRRRRDQAGAAAQGPGEVPGPQKAQAGGIDHQLPVRRPRPERAEGVCDNSVNALTQWILRTIIDRLAPVVAGLASPDKEGQPWR